MASIISTIAFSIALAAFQFSFPNAKALPNHLSQAELIRRYASFDLKMQGIGILLLVGITTLLYFLFAAIVAVDTHLQRDALFLIQPDRMALFVATMFLALFFSSMVYLSLAKRQLKESWPEFLLYNNYKYNMDYQKAFKVLIWILGVLGIAVSGIIMDSGTAFTENEIRFNNFLGIGYTTYSYADVTEVNEVLKLVAPNGNIVSDRHFVIHFNDGETWLSRVNGFMQVDIDQEIAQYVSEKASLEIQELEFDN